MRPPFVILTEGHTSPGTAKTACCLLRYRAGDVAAVLDSYQAGSSTQALLNTGGDTPVVGSLEEVSDARTLVIGIAPAGGKIPDSWRPVISEAISRGMDVVAGLHDFLNEDPELVQSARKHGVRLVDVRANDENSIAQFPPLRSNCTRIHTVGHDCSVGKMVVSVELNLHLLRLGRDSKFIATGQTGIMIEGDGCPIDRVIADFVSGAAERQIVENQDREFLIIEGQGSLVHPAYSAVTLGLLHGCRPHALIMCVEAGRDRVFGLEHVAIPPLRELIPIYETMAGIWHPCPILGVAMNRRKLNDEQARTARKEIEDETQLPVCDVLDEGPQKLVDAILDFKSQRVRTGEC